MTETEAKAGELGDANEALSHETIRQRALAGAALVAGRSVGLLGLAALGTTVLAHELSPRDFGLVAFGLAIMDFAAALANGGLGTALIRSSIPIDRPTLSSVFGLELTVTMSLLALIAVVAIPFYGLAGQLTAVMALSLPIGALVTPATIVLERSLAYRTLARVEMLQGVAYYTFAVGAVSLGAGVWGLAIAAVVQSATGVILLLRVRRDLFIRPSFSLSRVRPLLQFGLRFQANLLATVARDQGLNIGVAAIAGTSTLGIWSLARRLLQLPLLLFQTLWRVSFPAFSQLMTAGANARSLIERGANTASIGSGLILAPVAACAPGVVPTLFGQRWHEVGTIVPLSCAALVIAGPISVATAGYLYAAGDATSVLVATVVHSVVWVGVSLALLPVVGPIALPLGLILGSTADAILLARATQRRIKVRLFRSLLRPSVATLAAGGAGILFSTLAGATLVHGIISAVIALVVYGGLLAAVERVRTGELATTILSTLRSAAANTTPAAQDG